MLNFAVGPVMMEQEILDIGSNQIPYFRTKQFSDLMLENEKMLLECVNAPESSRVIFLTASGTAAMEATIMNLFSADDKVLIVNGGDFGRRFKEICKIHGIQFVEIKLNYFEPLTEEHLAPFDNQEFTGLLINVHETSTGVLYDMSLVSDFCKRNNMLFVADAISSFLADPYDMCKFGVNATILSSQKALALLPGMSYVVLDKKALEKMRDVEVRSLYFNFKDYLENGKRGQTPYTPAVSNLIQLHRRLKSILNVGVDQVVRETAKLANYFRGEIVDLPLKINTPSLSNSLTPLCPTGKMNAHEIFLYLAEKHDIFVVPSGGDLKESLFRVGHIGNINQGDLSTLVEILRAMYKAGKL